MTDHDERMDDLTGETGRVFACYMAALDEIHRLRQLLVLEASQAEALLEYKTFPAGARCETVASAARMRTAARGETRRALEARSSLHLQELLIEAGASATLTRGEWEAGQ